jgi:hypothetical protein
MATFDADKPPVYSPDPVITAEAVHVAAQQGPPPLRHTSPEAHTFKPAAALHWSMLIVATVVIMASFLLHVRNGEQVVVPILNAPLPGTCTFRAVTGLPCPGCGLTRSFISMGHGRLTDAWHYNPAGFFFFLVVVFQLPYRTYQLWRIRRGLQEYRFLRFDTWVLLALVAILLIQWFCDLAIHLL